MFPDRDRGEVLSALPESVHSRRGRACFPSLGELVHYQRGRACLPSLGELLHSRSGRACLPSLGNTSIKTPSSNDLAHCEGLLMFQVHIFMFLLSKELN